MLVLTGSTSEYKAIQDVTFYSSEFTRDLALTGVQTLSGFPFVPESLQVEAIVNSTKKICFGTMGSGRQFGNFIVGNTGDWLRTNGRLVVLSDTSANLTRASATIKPDKTIDLNWEHIGTGATGNVVFRILAFKHRE